MKWFILMVLGLAACGPIQATQGILGAENSLEQTRLQHSYTYAPYEYTKARLYLRMAKQTEGHSQFQAAARYANNAKKYSDHARAVTKDPRVLKLRREYEPEFKKFDLSVSKQSQESNHKETK